MRDILEILLSIPTVDLNITDSDGRNIAQIAVEKDDIEEYDLQCLELLANDARVNWNIKNADGETPIMYTMRERKEEMFQILKRTVSVIDNPDFLQDCFNAGKGRLQKKNTAYFMTSGKKVGGPKTKTKFQNFLIWTRF